MIFYVLLPVTTFIISLLIAKNNYWNKCKWLSSLIFGTMYMLAEYTTFSLSNMLAFDKINTPEWSMILIGSIISLIGLGIGTLIYKKTNK
jgi:hypothetical protein